MRIFIFYWSAKKIETTTALGRKANLLYSEKEIQDKKRRRWRFAIKVKSQGFKAIFQTRPEVDKDPNRSDGHLKVIVNKTNFTKYESDFESSLVRIRRSLSACELRECCLLCISNGSDLFFHVIHLTSISGLSQIWPD